MPAPQPDNWHPIRYNQIGTIQNIFELHVFVGNGYSVQSREGDVVADLTDRDPVFHPFNEIRNLNRIYPNAQSPKCTLHHWGIFEHPLVCDVSAIRLHRLAFACRFSVGFARDFRRGVLDGVVA